MESGGDKWSSLRHAKRQSNRHHQQINTQLTFYRLDALPVTQLTLSKHEGGLWPQKRTVYIICNTNNNIHVNVCVKMQKLY